MNFKEIRQKREFILHGLDTIMEITAGCRNNPSEIDESFIMAIVLRGRTSAHKVQMTLALPFKKWPQSLILASHKAETKPIDHSRKYYNYHNALCLSLQNFALALSSVSLKGHFNSQEKLKQCLCKILGWQTKSIMVCYVIFWSV